MITMAMIGKIRRMYYRDGLTISEIVKRTSLARNTVKKWLRAAPGVEPGYRRRAVVPHKLTAYVDRLVSMMETDARRPKRDRRTVKALFAHLQGEGYSGGYSRLTDFVRAWRLANGAIVGHAFVPLQFALGEAFQFDWSEEGVVIGGLYRKLQVAHMKLCASRAFWLIAYPSQGHEMLFDAHTRAFTALGGIARRGIYDNMKTAVDKVTRGKSRVVNTRFAAMCAHYLFDPDFCNVASGWEKGVVEKNVQDSRRRIWQDTSNRRFGSFDELNVWLGERCRALWQELRHPEHSRFTIAEMLEHEQLELMPMPAPFDGYAESLARVSSTCLVMLKSNRYSVPCELAGQMVALRLYPQQVVIVSNEAVVARHTRLTDRGHTSYDWQHYIPLVQRKPGVLRNGAPFADLPRPLQSLRQALLRHEGGDRVMAQVLAAVPIVGLEAVSVAVELAMETGAVSAEHVLNVIGRLRPTPGIDRVETSLVLKETPLADMERYDSLRTIVAGEDDHA